MRITGLASGMDIDSMVKELMKANQMKYDNMVKQRTLVEWQQEDYRTMASAIVDFRNNKLANYNISAAINAKTSEVGGDTNALTVNSISSSAAGSLNVKVNHVATAETKVFNVPPATSEDGVPSLKSLGFESDTGVDPDAPPNTVTIAINGKTISLSEDATLADLASQINANSSKFNATALYDADSGKFSLTATQTGTGKLDLSGAVLDNSGNPVLDDDDNPIMVNGFDSEDLLMDIDEDASIDGSDADVIINGISFHQASNKFTANGFDFTIKSETTAGATITVKQDTDKIVSTIKSFVDDYNKLIAFVNGELSEKKSYDYLPLSSDEKKELSDDDIKLYQDKARSGTLSNDTALSKMISDLRLIATDLVGGNVLNADGTKSSIGITTGSYTDKGKLVLDETKLRAALETDPDKVVSIFSGKDGVFGKMMDTTMDTLKSLSTKAGTSLTSTDTTASFLENSLLSTRIRDMKSQEDREQDRLTDLENHYYTIFSAMEESINKYNSQASSLFSMSQ